MKHLALFASLPASAGSERTRLWRALKTLGAPTLRDGVNVLPDTPEHAEALQQLADDATRAGGSAQLFRLAALTELQQGELLALYDRSLDYAAVQGDVDGLLAEATTADLGVLDRKLSALRRRYEAVRRIDFFPGETARQVQAAVDQLARIVAQRRDADEPTAVQHQVPQCDPAAYRGRVWATRARPWIDRLASAWLIRGWIDPEARFVWLATPADCRDDWVGFDFDGARFSHHGHRVTFETLLAAFDLDADPALARLARLVHYCDVGGLPCAEAAGIEAVLGGLRQRGDSDDTLLSQAGLIFDGLLQNFRQQQP